MPKLKNYRFSGAFDLDLQTRKRLKHEVFFEVDVWCNDEDEAYEEANKFINPRFGYRFIDIDELFPPPDFEAIEAENAKSRKAKLKRMKEQIIL